METMKDFYNKEDNTFHYEPNSKEFWAKILEYKKNKEILKGHVTALNYNGLVVEYDGFKMFMPTQNISIKRVDSMEQYLDQDIDFVILNVDTSKLRVIVSKKEIELAKKAQERKETLLSISVGSEFEGIVESVQNYGAFIKIGNGISGLCHISELSHKHIKKIDGFIKVGDKVNVKVIKNDNGKLSFSMKALEKQEDTKNEPIDNNVDYKNVKLPTGEASTSLGDLFKDLNI